MAADLREPAFYCLRHLPGFSVEKRSQAEFAPHPEPEQLAFSIIRSADENHGRVVSEKLVENVADTRFGEASTVDEETVEAFSTDVAPR